ncbi:MAG: hypothetical protein Q9210_007260, partial [Variospora velana]
MRPPISSQSWQEHRHLIQRLYVDQGRPLPEVVEEVDRLTGFWATERQYKRRISAWSLDKNIRDDEMRAIIAIRVRRLRRGKQSLFYVRDRQVNSKKIARFARRKSIDWNHYDEAHPDHRMLSQAIRCITPPSDGRLVHAPLLPSKRTQHPQRDENEVTTATAQSNISHVLQKATLATPDQRPTTVDAYHRNQSERIPVPNLKYIHRSLSLATLIRDHSPSYPDFDFMLPQARQAVVRTNSPPSLSTVISAPAYHRTLPEPPEINIDFPPPHEHLHNEDHSKSTATDQLPADGYSRASISRLESLSHAPFNGPAGNAGNYFAGVGPVSHPRSSLGTGLTPPKGGDSIFPAGRNPTPKLEWIFWEIWQNLQTLQHRANILNERSKVARASAARSSSPPREADVTRGRPPFVPTSLSFTEKPDTISPKEASLSYSPEDNFSMPLVDQEQNITSDWSYSNRSEERRSEAKKAET